MIKIIEKTDSLIKILTSKTTKFIDNELVILNNDKRGFILNSSEKEALIVMIDDIGDVKSNLNVKLTQKRYNFSIPNDLLGKVYDKNLNELKLIKDFTPKPAYILKASKKELSNIPLFSIDYKSQIDSRSAINEPILTGKISIDSTLPIGMGQRQLIIGDRRTGKTAIALSAIIAQKYSDVICVYVSIANKKSNLISVVNKLIKNNAFNNTVIVSSESNDTAGSNYITPYIGMAIAEKFQKEGKDVLIIFDDLSKHARSYRSISLVAKMPVGREGYPGDIFYQHSKLLERSGKFNNKFGGGSITALPIAETQQEDISSYISTNIISITDGQIFTSNKDFNSHKRPAVNIPFSVSRVGGDAQHKFTKKASSHIKNNISQAIQILKRSINIDSIYGENKRRVKEFMIFSKLSSQNEDNIQTQEEQWILLVMMQERMFDHFKNKDIVYVRNVLMKTLKEDKTFVNFLFFLKKEFKSESNNDNLLRYYVSILFGSFILWIFRNLYKKNDQAYYRKKISAFDKYDNYEFSDKLLSINEENLEDENKFEDIEKTILIDIANLDNEYKDTKDKTKKASKKDLKKKSEKEIIENIDNKSNNLDKAIKNEKAVIEENSDQQENPHNSQDGTIDELNANINSSNSVKEMVETNKEKTKVLVTPTENLIGKVAKTTKKTTKTPAKTTKKPTKTPAKTTKKPTKTPAKKQPKKSNKN